MLKAVKFFGAVAVACAAFVTASGAAVAQDASNYPNKLIHIVVPYPAGGATDTLGRMVAERLGQAWGQPVIVENRPGASGNIGGDMVAKSSADGYTLLVGITAMIQAPHLYSNMPFDPFKAFAPVTLLAHSANLFVVPANSPANSLKEFLALAKGDPKKYNYGSYGNGTSAHIHGEMLKSQASVDLLHVPYKGSSPMVTDLLGGQLTSGLVDVASARAHLDSGRLKVLAVSGGQRFKMLPNVPTFTELGFHSFEPYGWFGVFAPAGAPKGIVDKLSAEISRAVASPEFASRIEALGLQPGGDSADEYARIMKRDSETWGKAIREANIRLD